MSHRQPTRHDIGRTVIVDNTAKPYESVLRVIEYSVVGTSCFCHGDNDDGQWYDIGMLKIKCDPTSADDQLAVAADYHEGTIVEQVLRVASQMDAATLQNLLLYQPGMALIVGRFRGYDLHVANHAARRDITEGTTAKDVTP